MAEMKGKKEEPQGKASERAELRKISTKRLRKILEEHQKWLDSNGVKGEKAGLTKANLRKADLIGANLRKADLERANLIKASLNGTSLRESNLKDANLTGLTGLQGGKLAGANVSGTKLPEDVAKFEEGFKVVEEASRNARKLFFAMLSACAYALLTIATTTDVRLLTNSASSPLPIIRTEIPIVWFYIAAPLVLLCVYFYFHLYMQRLWEGLALLPAVFPDGRPLDQKAYPWLLIGLVRAHVFHLKENRPPLSHLQEWISVALGWWFMPATLICFWLRYLPRQDWFGTALHIALLVVSVWAGALFYRLAVGTLRGDESELSLWKKPFGEVGEVKMYKRGVVALSLGMVALLLSSGTINCVRSDEFRLSDVQQWVPYVCDQFGFSPFANFREKDVSTKPANWSGKAGEIKGAPLKGRSLRCVDGYRAFLVNADLREANLQKADLEEAYLQEARLGEANLQKADLRRANLQKANLEYANLQEAYLFGANLREADFSGAKLQKATLAEASLEKANLRWAELQEASLFAAFLLGAKLWGANLQKALLFKANLQKADFERANLHEADFFKANLREADFEAVDLTGAKDLTVEQLSKVKTLYKAKLDPQLMDQIKQKYPHLLVKPKAKEIIQEKPMAKPLDPKEIVTVQGK